MQIQLIFSSFLGQAPSHPGHYVRHECSCRVERPAVITSSRKTHPLWLRQLANSATPYPSFIHICCTLPGQKKSHPTDLTVRRIIQTWRDFFPALELISPSESRPWQQLQSFAAPPLNEPTLSAWYYLIKLCHFEFIIPPVHTFTHIFWP